MVKDVGAMWISRNKFNFLKENAEKNIDAECEILTVQDNMRRSVARAMEEYSSTLEALDKYKEEYHKVLSALKCHCETVDMILTKTIKTENGEENSVDKFKSVEALAVYMKCFNDNIMTYVKEKFDETSTEK